ncbi:MAG: response regulator [Ethanoligenens sp.]
MENEPQADILIVDDSPEHIEAVAHVLRNNGFRTRVAPNGTRALALLHKKAPDLILLDVFMPGMDGFEVCRRIRSDPEIAGTPIIFFTAVDDESSVRKAFELGAQDYVTKPFKPSELLARTRAHIQLHRQAAALEAAYDSLDSFSYTVAHDLKAPLLSMQKLTDYLAEDYADKLDDDGQELVGLIHGKSAEMVAMVNRLLEFSSLSGMSLHKEPLALAPVFEEVYQELMRLQPPRSVEFCVDSLPPVLADRIMLRLLVTNVLANAIKYTRQRKKAAIAVTGTEDSGFVTIEVRDNGAGFDMRYASKLFKVFQRLHAQSEFEGTGAGLAIVQRIAQRHGGTVWMTGEVDRGASFFMRLPAAGKPPAPGEDLSIRP